jgi:L-lactate utilization protein LutC
LTYVALSIQENIGTEIVRFLSGKVPSSGSIRQLPLLSQFLTLPAASGTVKQVHVKEQEFLVPTLASILGAQYNIGFGQWISNVLIPVSRKRKLRNQTNSKIAEILKAKCDAATAATLQTAIVKAAKAIKVEIVASGSSKELAPVTFQKMVKLTGMNTPFLDLTAINPANIAVSTAAFERMRSDNVQRTNIRSTDEKGAADVLTRHVISDVED